MLIHEVCKITNLTKKAIAYYIGQGLLSPAASENGYRDFKEEHVECLNRISVLRKLGLGTEEIRAVLNDGTNTVLQKLSVKKELFVQKEEKRSGSWKNYRQIWIIPRSKKIRRLWIKALRLRNGF